MRNFEYYSPVSLDEAFELLTLPGAKPLAGGTDIIPRMKKELMSVGAAVDIKRIPDLARIESKAGKIHIGPLATHAQIADSSLLSSEIPVLPRAALTMAGPQIRNMGTIGGNICNASPAGDLIPPLICLRAEFELSSKDGVRLVAADDFFTGPGTTVLRKGEILTDIVIPTPSAGYGAVYLKLGRRKAMEIAQVGVACAVELRGRRIENPRIALGAVAPTPVRAHRAEEILAGASIDAEIIFRAAEAAAESCSPIDDVRAPADYRREMVITLTRRAVSAAIEEAGR